MVATAELALADKMCIRDRNGDMGSPFDLSEIETEQEPRGQVTLVGTRRGREQKWVLGPDDWRIHARPTLPAALLASYTTGQQLALSLIHI